MATMISTHKFTRHASTLDGSGAAGTTKWKGDCMSIFELWLEANALWLELDLQLFGLRHVSCDNRKLQARDDLELWFADYEANRASYVDGFNAVQRALDLLEGAAPEDEVRI